MRASPTQRGGIGLPAQEISRTVQAALERLARIQAALPKAAAPAAADIRAQLAWLAPAGFLLTTPWERLQEFPRYLQAIEQRLEKLGRDPRRDAQLAAEIAPLETRYRERVKAERGLRPPGEDEFRWMLEEFRVSLFAQQLRTRGAGFGAAARRRLGCQGTGVMTGWRHRAASVLLCRYYIGSPMVENPCES